MKKKLMVGLTVMSVLALTATSAFATGVADAAVSTAMATAQENVVATIADVVPKGLGIFLAIIAIRYGKKAFRSAAA